MPVILPWRQVPAIESVRLTIPECRWPRAWALARRDPTRNASGHTLGQRALKSARAHVPVAKHVPPAGLRAQTGDGQVV